MGPVGLRYFVRSFPAEHRKTRDKQDSNPGSSDLKNHQPRQPRNKYRVILRRAPNARLVTLVIGSGSKFRANVVIWGSHLAIGEPHVQTLGLC